MGALFDRLIGVVIAVKLALIDDSGAQQTAQATFRSGAPDGVREVIDKVTRLGEYGFYSCPPEGSEALVVFLGGRRSMPVVIATGHRADRPKDMKPGEASLFNTVAGQYVIASEDGKFRSLAPDWLHDGDFHVSGSAYAEHLIPADGWDGTFQTGDGRTATVTHGIITNVA